MPKQTPTACQQRLGPARTEATLECPHYSPLTLCSQVISHVVVNMLLDNVLLWIVGLRRVFGQGRAGMIPLSHFQVGVGWGLQFTINIIRSFRCRDSPVAMVQIGARPALHSGAQPHQTSVSASRVNARASPARDQTLHQACMHCMPFYSTAQDCVN